MSTTAVPQKCDSCEHLSGYTTGMDEYPPCTGITFCNKGHWENGDPAEEFEIDYWANCPDYQPKTTHQ